MEDGSVVPRTAGTPQGGVVSPCLANLFLHYAFDEWMEREFPDIPFERYADDLICHCRSEEEARALWGALEARFETWRLALHPQKTKLVYCKDANRRGDYPSQKFDFLGYEFRPRPPANTRTQGSLGSSGSASRFEGNGTRPTLSNSNYQQLEQDRYARFQGWRGSSASLGGRFGNWGGERFGDWRGGRFRR